MGANANATIYGGLQVNGVSNVIVRNLNIQGVWPNSGPDDSLSSRDSHNLNPAEGVPDIVTRCAGPQ